MERTPLDFSALGRRLLVTGLVLLMVFAAGEYLCRRLYENADLCEWGTVSTEQKARLLDGLRRSAKSNAVVVIGGPLLATGVWAESIDATSHQVNWDVAVTNLATLDENWVLQRRWLAEIFEHHPPYMVVVDAQALRQPKFSSTKSYWHPTAWRYKTVCRASSSLVQPSLLTMAYCPLAQESYFIRFLPNLIDALNALPDWVGNPGWYYTSRFYRNNPVVSPSGTMIWGGEITPSTLTQHSGVDVVDNQEWHDRLRALIQPYQAYPTRWVIVDTVPRSWVGAYHSQPSEPFARTVWLDPHLTVSDYGDDTHLTISGLLHLTHRLEAVILRGRLPKQDSRHE